MSGFGPVGSFPVASLPGGGLSGTSVTPATGSLTLTGFTPTVGFSAVAQSNYYGFYLETLRDGPGQLNLSGIYVEVLRSTAIDTTVEVRAHALFVEVLRATQDGPNEARVHGIYVEVLRDIRDVVPDRYALALGYNDPSCDFHWPDPVDVGGAYREDERDDALPVSVGGTYMLEPVTTAWHPRTARVRRAGRVVYVTEPRAVKRVALVPRRPSRVAFVNAPVHLRIARVPPRLPVTLVTRNFGLVLAVDYTKTIALSVDRR